MITNFRSTRVLPKLTREISQRPFFTLRKTNSFSRDLSPVERAADLGRVDELKRLYDKGESVSKSALVLAIQKGHLPVVSYLFSKNLKINETGYVSVDEIKDTSDPRWLAEYWTPLHWAAHEDNVEIARFLVNRGADINFISPVKSYPQPSAMEVAIQRGSAQFIEYVLDFEKTTASTGGQIEAPHQMSEVAFNQLLKSAVDKGEFTLARVYLKKYPEFEIQSDEKGNTLFHRLVQAYPLRLDEAKRFIADLVQRGANIDALNHDEHTALFLAAKYSKLTAAKALIQEGADPTIDGKDGNAFHAAKSNDEEQEMIDVLNGNKDHYSIDFLLSFH